MYPVFDVDGLADFTGRPVDSYSDYATQAIKQATLFFKKATCLAQFPTDPDNAELATNAIYELADYFVLAQPYQTILATPFSSESIGSYSYSKMVSKITSRQKTDLLWFDMAVSDLGQCDFMGGGAFSMGGIEAFEHDSPMVAGSNGNRRLVGPADDLSRAYVFPYAGDLDTAPEQDPSDGTWDGGTP